MAGPQERVTMAVRKKNEEKTWEDRVVALEVQLEQAAERTSALEVAVAAKDATISALEAVVAAHKAAEEDRKAKASQDYLTGLQSKATNDHQSPIPAEDLAHVKALLDAGQDETARILGDAFLARSEARGSVSAVSSAAPATSLGTSSAGSDLAQFTANLLNQTGLKAEVRDGQVVTNPKRLKLS